MKIKNHIKFLFIALGIPLVFSIYSFATDGPPAKVLAAFAKKFPNAESVDWEKDGLRNWEAEFEINEVGHSANFNSSGDWLETEIDINEGDIPQSVLDGLNRDFAGAKILSCTKIELKSGLIKIEMDIKFSGKHKEVEYSLTGKKLK